ncbi:MAG: cupredoxin domain-containing protein [Nitrososphaerales archaeon]
MSSTPQVASTSKPVRGMGPAIIVVLIICAALLGYYQFSYYPSVASNTTSSASITPVTPHIANITILVGAQSAPRALTFSPNVATVYLGYNSTVVWTNVDGTLHTVTANTSAESIDPTFYSWGLPTGFNNIQPKGDPGDSLNFTFTVAGTYGYYCKYHANMIGTIIVKPAPSNLTSSSSSKSSTLTSSSTAILGGVVLSYLVSEETVFASSLATLTGSGTAP